MEARPAAVLRFEAACADPAFAGAFTVFAVDLPALADRFEADLPAEADALFEVLDLICFVVFELRFCCATYPRPP
jgi:hypothetical protein